MFLNQLEHIIAITMRVIAAALRNEGHKLLSK